MTKSAFDYLFDADDAANLRVRADLMNELRIVVQELGKTQAEVAEILGVTRPRVSDLVRGKIELFTIDALVNIATRLNRQIEIHISNSESEAA